MATRYFLLPYESFTGEPGEYGAGRTLFRPKYKGEIGFHFKAEAAPAPAKGFVLIGIPDYKGSDEHIEQLLAKPDVEEIKLTAEATEQGKIDRVRQLTKTLPLARTATGAELVESIKSSVREQQRAETRRHG
jgi:hypothetical protein